MDYDRDVSLHLFRALKVKWYKTQELERDQKERLCDKLADLKLDRAVVELSRYKPPVLRIPEVLICPITLEMMEDPVVTEAGISYERHAIEEHLKANGLFDPHTRKPVSLRLIPNLALKQIVSRFLEDNPWAFDYIEGENWRLLQI
jgi:STIP1 homology and U-box containing protein 1